MDETKTCIELYNYSVGVIVDAIKNGEALEPDVTNTSILLNIAHSLAVIADKMCEKEEE